LFNLELAKKPVECIEYIVVHELAHLVERRHDDRFRALLDRHLPRWQASRRELNAGPLGDWTR
jgi:predicted metal-dependent hydrolase